jgi:hypothetical protein
MTIKSVQTTYEVVLTQPVRLRTEYLDVEDPSRNYLLEAVEATEAVVTVSSIGTRTVTLLGYDLTKAGTRTKRKKTARTLNPQVVVTRNGLRDSIHDSSAYDAVVAAVLAEVDAYETRGGRNIA